MWKLIAGATLTMVAVLGPARAEEGQWTVGVAWIVMEAYGHDQHVLTIRETDLDPTPTIDGREGVTLDTDGGPAYRLTAGYTRGAWRFGLDFLWFSTSQNAARTAAADGPSGPIDEVTFEIADRSFTSTDPAEVLFYERLEDTDLATWTVDLYAERTFAETPNGKMGVLFGLRNADFDNDYRAAVGIRDVVGTRIDAASNYDRLIGPLLGVSGEIRWGRQRLEGRVAHSLLLSSVELTVRYRDFTGPFGDAPAFVAQEDFRNVQDVAIPVSDLRLRWSYRIGKRVELGLGADTSVWWDVAVPPGVIPGEDGDGVFHENTIVFFGLLGGVEVTF